MRGRGLIIRARGGWGAPSWTDCGCSSFRIHIKQTPEVTMLQQSLKQLNVSLGECKTLISTVQPKGSATQAAALKRGQCRSGADVPITVYYAGCTVREGGNVWTKKSRANPSSYEKCQGSSSSPEQTRHHSRSHLEDFHIVSTSERTELPSFRFEPAAPVYIGPT